MGWFCTSELPRLDSAKQGELLRCTFPASRLPGAHPRLPAWQELTWGCWYTSMSMTYSLHTGAESEYVRVKRSSCKHLRVSGRLCPCILKNTTALCPDCGLALRPCFHSGNPYISPSQPPPSSTDSSTAKISLLTTDLLFSVLCSGPQD